MALLRDGHLPRAPCPGDSGPTPASPGVGGLSHLRGLGEQQDRVARALLPGEGEEGVPHPPGPLPWFSSPAETRVCPPVAYQHGPGGRTVHPHLRKANEERAQIRQAG